MHFLRGYSWHTAAVSASVLFVGNARDLCLLKRVLISRLKLLSSRVKRLAPLCTNLLVFIFVSTNTKSLVQHLFCPNHHSLLVLHGFSDTKSHLLDLI